MDRFLLIRKLRLRSPPGPRGAEQRGAPVPGRGRDAAAADRGCDRWAVARHDERML